MYKILFTHSYFLRFDAKQWATGNPIRRWVLICGRNDAEKGYEVDFADTMFAHSPEEILIQSRNTSPTSL
jgi:hypothetical protein